MSADLMAASSSPVATPAARMQVAAKVAQPVAAAEHVAAQAVAAPAVAIAKVTATTAKAATASSAMPAASTRTVIKATVPPPTAAAVRTTTAASIASSLVAAKPAVTAAAAPSHVTTVAAVQPRIVYIDPSAATQGNGTLAHPYSGWDFGALRAGTTYLQMDGTTYTGVVYVGTAATAGAPIQIGAYGSGAAPTIDGTVDFAGASNVAFSGFQLSNPSGAAVVIQQGSSNIDVSGNVITNSGSGIWLGNYAGANDTIANNVVVGCTGAGILVDTSLATADDPTTVSDNLVADNGADGILLTTNNALVSGNTVVNNGLLESGTSGIHVYTSSATTGTGEDNVITGNVVAYNHDFTDQDGNGILLDQWTNNNVVSDNLALGNDGAGIGLYDSYANTVSGNTTLQNSLNPGDTHSILAELVLNDSLGLTRDNAITGNTFLGFQSDGFTAFVSTGAADAGNSFSGNILENLAGPDVYQIAGIRGASLGAWDSMLGANDHFSGVSIATPTGGSSYDFTFPAGTSLTVDGHTWQLTGWSAAGGLFGT